MRYSSSKQEFIYCCLFTSFSAILLLFSLGVFHILCQHIFLEIFDPPPLCQQFYSIMSVYFRRFLYTVVLHRIFESVYNYVYIDKFPELNKKAIGYQGGDGKSLEALGFLPKDKIPLHYLCGDGSMIFMPDDDKPVNM